MAKITDNEITKELKQVNEPISKDQDQINLILEKLNNLEKENQLLRKSQEDKGKNMFIKAKEKYEGPLTYSFKLWWWVPVCNYTSVKKDKTKDWLYKYHWEFVSNHYLDLTLADGSNVKVEVNEFNASFTKSEYYEAKNEDWKIITTKIAKLYPPKSYTFETEEYWTFTVDPKIIN